MPREERVRRGNVLLKTRPRDVEETLLQLINDDDPVTAAAAIDVVREQKMWSLADDVEHVLAHRDVNDWYVFEAASWALAEQRMPAERRRELWLEPLPPPSLRAVCGACRSSRRSPSTSCSGSPARRGRCATNRAACSTRKARSRRPFTSCSTAA